MARFSALSARPWRVRHATRYGLIMPTNLGLMAGDRWLEDDTGLQNVRSGWVVGLVERWRRRAIVASFTAAVRHGKTSWDENPADAWLMSQLWQ